MPTARSRYAKSPARTDLHPWADDSGERFGSRNAAGCVCLVCCAFYLASSRERRSESRVGLLAGDRSDEGDHPSGVVAHVIAFAYL